MTAAASIYDRTTADVATRTSRIELLGLLYGIIAFTIALTGPGSLSLDRFLDRGRRWVGGGARLGWRASPSG